MMEEQQERLAEGTQNQADQRPVIGRASATERDPNSAERFAFWIRPGERVNPFDIVAAEHFDGSMTYGLVTNIRHVTDAASHLANYISNDFGESVDEPNTPRQGANVAEVAVLANDQDIYMPVQSEARVRFADEKGIHVALGIDTMKEKEERTGKKIRIPAGIIRMSNGEEAVAYLDVEYVLGPEAAHVNISGISGLATKTSYAMFLIQSILQTIDSENIATILLNVKYDDLLHIHEPRELTKEEREVWERMGLRPEPFPEDKVHYLLPWGKNSRNTGRPNIFNPDDAPAFYKMYAYALRDSADKLDLLFSHVPDPWDTLMPLIGEIQSGIEAHFRDWKSVQTWEDLFTQAPYFDQNGQIRNNWRGIRGSTIGRFLRILRRIVHTKQSGIFVDNISTRMTTISHEISQVRGGHVYVVDIAKLKDHEQTLVFGDILRTLHGLYSGEVLLEEDEAELPDKVIVFVDELNKYAPARGEAAQSPILEQVLDISERGRSFGIVLFSAQQFLSAVHPRVTGNAATKVLGRTDSAELSEGAYRFLDKDIKMHLTRLEKGELILSHPIYRQPIKIRFPRPPFRQGRGKV